MWAKSPAPVGFAGGKETTRIYDALGRLQKETLVNTGAYTRYEYPANAIQSKVYTTIEDTNNNGADAADEVLSEGWSDGAGRTLKSKTLLPISGSADGWSGSLVEYDKLGRVARSSVPTEISVSGNIWTPAGDDAGRGWLWQSQKYDWKNRVTEKTNTDGTFQTISYDGCGCAGGQTTTISGEEIFTTDWNGTNPVSLGRRTQKIYEDVLGRTKKTEILDWNNSVYSTTVAKFNGRDQAYAVTKYAGGEDADNAHQETTMSYDGFGRTKTRHRPEQVGANNTAAYTTYNYYADGNISSVVDARGATANYTYDSRGLATGISYAVPTGSTITPTASVTFTYDEAGNRKKMTDGLGTVDYTYTNLSQLKTEKRTFSDTLADAPAGGNGFLLSYDYTLSGQLKYITDSYGQQFNYGYDKVGRLQSVVGSTAFSGISTYASNPTYNARGTLTALSYGNGVSMAVTGFNNKLQATGFEVKKGVDKYIDKQYKFYEDGSLKFIDDGLDERFDRSYKYDFIGRTTEGKAGIAARGGTSTDEYKFDQPYTMQYTHDAFGHMTSKTGYYYGSQDNTSYSYNSNDRNPGWSYDAEGNITSDDNAVYDYDAAGRLVKTTEINLDNSSQMNAPTMDYFDGDGQLLKRVANAGSTTAPLETKSYFIRSSALGKVISEADATGKKSKTFVPANGTTLATQILHTSTNPPTEVLTFNHTDASGTGAQQTTASGALSGTTTYNRTAEYSPLGRNIADAGPYTTLNTNEPPEFGAGVNLFPSAEGYRPGRNEFTLEGIPVPESAFQNVINSGFVGGAFGLLAYSVRMSVRDYSVRFNDGNMQLERFFSSEGEAKNFAFRMNQTTVFKNILVSNAWFALAAITPKAQGQTKQDEKPPEKTLEKFHTATEDALKALEKESCRKLFGENVDAIGLLQSLIAAVGPTLGAIELGDLGAYNVTRDNQGRISRSGFGGKTQGITGTYINKNGRRINIFTGAHIRINSNENGPFVEGFYDFLGVGASDRTYRAITIIHELGHAIARIEGSKSSKILDDDDAQISQDNSRRVYDACFKE